MVDTEMDNIISFISKYVGECREKSIDMRYITWDRREKPDVDIGYTILSKNEYCRYRGETDECKMIKMLETTNHNEWLILIKNDYETSLSGFDTKLCDRAISLIQKLYPLQNKLGFILCIKVVRYTSAAIESHIYNITTTDYWTLLKKYFEDPTPWYIFAIPQRL
jgi:hypothetical protein